MENVSEQILAELKVWLCQHAYKAEKVKYGNDERYIKVADESIISVLLQLAHIEALAVNAENEVTIVDDEHIDLLNAQLRNIKGALNA